MRFEDYLDEMMENPEFKAGYEESEKEFELSRIILEERKQTGMTQKELAKKCGVSQGDISRIENGISKNLKYNTSEKVAKALGKKIQIKFV